MRKFNFAVLAVLFMMSLTPGARAYTSGSSQQAGQNLGSPGDVYSGDARAGLTLNSDDNLKKESKGNPGFKVTNQYDFTCEPIPGPPATNGVRKCGKDVQSYTTTGKGTQSDPSSTHTLTVNTTLTCQPLQSNPYYGQCYDSSLQMYYYNVVMGGTYPNDPNNNPLSPGETIWDRQDPDNRSNFIQQAIAATNKNAKPETGQFKLDESVGLKSVTKDANSDPCEYGVHLAQGSGKNFSCGNTEAFVSGVAIGQAAVQAVGQAVQNNVGTVATNQAAQQGTQSAALQATATSMKSSGELHLLTGVGGLVAGYMEMQKAKVHNQNAAEINSELNEGKDLQSAEKVGAVGDGYVAMTTHNAYTDDGTHDGSDMKVVVKAEAQNKSLLQNLMSGGKDAKTGNIIGGGTFGDLNAGLKNENVHAVAPDTLSQQQTSFTGVTPLTNNTYEDKATRHQQAADRVTAMAIVVKGIQNETVKEQQNEANKVTTASVDTLVNGAKALITSMGELAGAKELQNAANTAAGTSITAPGADPFAAPSNSPIQGAITGAATAAPATAAADNAATTPPNGLGNGFNNAPNPGASGNPTPANFVAATPVSPQSGGGPGGGGATGTSPATGDPNADQAPKQLANDNARYDGGTYGSAGGGRGGAADKGPDLSGLLAQFLPKKEEEFGGKTLEFGGGRNPASEQPISLLDRNTNIFERIHEAYQEKNRRGTIGIF